MIGELPDGQGPRVRRYQNRKVALLADDPDDPSGEHGFLLSPGAAVDTAVKMLSAVEDIAGHEAFGFDVEGFTGRIVQVPGAEAEARLTLHFRGARFTAMLTPTQLAELAAGLGLGARRIDEPGGPPTHDR